MDDSIGTLAGSVQQRYYGKYRGFVVNNEDPEMRGRLQITVPSVLGEVQTGWALPCLPFGGATNQGLFMIPEVDAQVWVEFEEGNVNQPIWVGVFWQQSSDTPEEGAVSPPSTRVIRTPSGHVLQFDDESGAEKFRLAHPAGTEMIIDENGSVETTDAGGNRMTMDANAKSIQMEDGNGNKLTMDNKGVEVINSAGNKVKMESSGITVEGTTIMIKGQMVELGGPGGEPLVKGQTFMSMFNAHTHVCTAPGAPSGPPLPPLTPAAMTMKTKAV